MDLSSYLRRRTWNGICKKWKSIQGSSHLHVSKVGDMRDWTNLAVSEKQDPNEAAGPGQTPVWFWEPWLQRNATTQPPDTHPALRATSPGPSVGSLASRMLLLRLMSCDSTPASGSFRHQLSFTCSFCKNYSFITDGLQAPPDYVWGRKTNPNVNMVLKILQRKIRRAQK